MRKAIKLGLRIMNIFDIILMLIVYPIALYSEITDAIKIESLLEILRIPLSYDQFIFVCWGMTAVLILTSWLLKKL